MTAAPDTSVLAQLLGRIVYFHALFIAPDLQSVPIADPGDLCCNHSSNPGQRTRYGLLATSAWSALDEIATGLKGYDRRCPDLGRDCCATCRVADCAAAVVDAWLTTEMRAYDLPDSDAEVRQSVRAQAARQLSTAFAGQYQAHCPTQDGHRRAGGPRPHVADELPLTGELLALWQNPLARAEQPVISWLNHCTALTDIRRVLDSRRTT